MLINVKVDRLKRFSYKKIDQSIYIENAYQSINAEKELTDFLIKQLIKTYSHDHIMDILKHHP